MVKMRKKNTKERINFDKYRKMVDNGIEHWQITVSTTVYCGGYRNHLDIGTPEVPMTTAKGCHSLTIVLKSSSQMLKCPRFTPTRTYSYHSKILYDWRLWEKEISLSCKILK